MTLLSAFNARHGRYLFFGLAAIGLLMATIDMSIVAVAIPDLTRSLDTSLEWVGWTLTGYQLVQIVALPVAGKLSDELGRKRVFMFCVACFTLGSLLCGLAPNIGFLILFRALQAIGAGGLVPSAVGIVSDQFKERRYQAIGLFTSIAPIGGILGPNIGGWIIEQWSWREIFFVNLPIGLVILVGVQLLLKENSRTARAQHIDYRGLALFAGGMVAFMYAMTAAGSDATAWQSPLLWSLVPLAVVLFLLFYKQEQRAAEPMVEIRLLVTRPFLQANLYNFIFGVCIFGFFSFIPYFAVVQYGMSTAQSGAVLTPRALVMMLASTLSSLFIIRLGYRRPMIGGMALLTTGMLLLSFGWNRVTFGPLELDGFWLMAIEVAVTGIGTGLVAPASNNAVLELLPSRAAAITGLRNMFRLGGGILGISAITLGLSFFEDKAAGLRTMFFALAIFVQLSVPLALMIPDTARDRRRREVTGLPVLSESSDGLAGDGQRR